jgi:ADP-ribose pyrophosphatase YjhB (NUDIX family)
MPQVECLLTRDNRLLVVDDVARPGSLAPPRWNVLPGESPLQACVREVLASTGLHVTPSCAGVTYAAAAPEHDYTLVFIADAPAPPGGVAGQHWVELQDLRRDETVSALYRELIPLFLTADGPLVVFLEGEGDQTRLREFAPIPHARLSPLVFATAP